MSEMFGEISGIFRPVEDTSFIDDVAEVAEHSGASLEPFNREVIRLQHIAQALGPIGREVLIVDNVGVESLLNTTPSSFADSLEIESTSLLMRKHPHRRNSGKRVFDIAIGVSHSIPFQTERQELLTIDGIEDRYNWRRMVKLGRIAVAPGVRTDELRQEIEAAFPSQISFAPGVIDAQFKLTQE